MEERGSAPIYISTSVRNMERMLRSLEICIEVLKTQANEKDKEWV